MKLSNFWKNCTVGTMVLGVVGATNMPVEEAHAQPNRHQPSSHTVNLQNGTVDNWSVKGLKPDYSIDNPEDRQYLYRVFASTVCLDEGKGQEGFSHQGCMHDLLMEVASKDYNGDLAPSQ
ncbi:MAG: hypothetical protein DHS20C02_03330 [Micavibrio sp.]|nr:MAG: hypothetical protein DHS20C02_03330 [Micavibrio sp.]